MSTSTPNHKPWLVLDETIPAEEGLSLLGTVVTNVQFPTSCYEPRSSKQPSQHPFLQPNDLLEPYFEDRTISTETHSGRIFETGLCSFIYGNTGSTKSRQAEITSTCITTYSLRSPDDVFKKIRDDPKYWRRVEELMRTSGSKMLYFVRGYKTAINPIITLQNSSQRSHGVELTLPVLTAATGGLNLPAGIMIGDPRFATGVEKRDVTAQRGLIRGERLFAVQYWTLVKKRVAREQQPKRGYFRWGKSERTDGLQSKPLPGKTNIMFGHDDDSELEDDDDDINNVDDDDDDSNDEDDSEWTIEECMVDALV